MVTSNISLQLIKIAENGNVRCKSYLREKKYIHCDCDMRQRLNRSSEPFDPHCVGIKRFIGFKNESDLSTSSSIDAFAVISTQTSCFDEILTSKSVRLEVSEEHDKG